MAQSKSIKKKNNLKRMNKLIKRQKKYNNFIAELNTFEKDVFLEVLDKELKCHFI